MAVCASFTVRAQTLQQLWQTPTNDYRVKTWWFKENHAVDVAFRLQDQPSKVIVWHHVTGRRTTLKKRADGSYRLRLKPVESVCMTYRIIH